MKRRPRRKRSLPPESSSPHPGERSGPRLARRHGDCVRGGSHTSRPRSPARRSPPAPRARRPGPACPRTPRSRSAASCPGPSGCERVGSVGAGSVSFATARAGPEAALPGPSRTAPSSSHPHRRPRPLSRGRRLVSGPAHRSGVPVSGTAPRARVALVPLPSEVPVTCSPTSTRWSWFPPEARIHTGRLRSAGSGCHPVPRRPRSYAALRLPRFVGLGSGSPRLRPTPMRTLFLAASGGSASTMASEKGSPDSPWLRCLSRKTRASQVPGPSSSCVPWSKTPPGACHPSPCHRIGTTAFAFRQFNTLGTRYVIDFEATLPRPTRSRAYASPVVSPRPSQGSLPARAGSPLAGRVSHPRDDVRSFMESSHPPFLFDQPCLVALKALSVPARRRGAAASAG